MLRDTFAKNSISGTAALHGHEGREDACYVHLDMLQLVLVGVLQEGIEAHLADLNTWLNSRGRQPIWEFPKIWDA